MDMKSILNIVDDALVQDNYGLLLMPKGQVPFIGPEQGDTINHGVSVYFQPKSLMEPNTPYRDAGIYRFVLSVNGSAISSLVVSSDDGVTGLVTHMFTEPKYRNKGYARHLYKKAQKHFLSLAFKENFSSLGKSWLDSNKIS